jgi:hypothetical protein
VSAKTDDPDAPPAAAGAPTLDDVFQGNARRRADALALLDPSDRPSFTRGLGCRLTYREANRAVSTLARRLGELGLPPDAVVATQLPNTVESIIALLAILRAGLVAAPLPLLWRHAEAGPPLAKIGARAVITGGQVAGTDYGEIALNIAAETFGIRYVCGFGEDVSDGMVALGNVFAEEPTAAWLRLPRHGNAERTAVITFETGPEGPCPVAHTHTALLVGGLAVVLETGMRRDAVLLGAMLSSSYAVLAATFIPWLLTGGTLALHQPFDLSSFVAQLRDLRCDAAVLPAPLVYPLSDAGIIGGSEGPSIVGLWRSPEQQPGSPRWGGTATLVDVLAFGECGLVPLRRRENGAPGVMSSGPFTAPSGLASGTVVMTLDRTAGGTLALCGPMVPRSGATATPATETRPSHTGNFADTGYPCRIDQATGVITLSGPPADVVRIGGYRFALTELQDLVSQAGANGILAALPHLLCGQKLAGAAGDAASVQRTLAALGINPLVGAAFRERGDGRAPAA